MRRKGKHEISNGVLGRRVRKVLKMVTRKRERERDYNRVWKEKCVLGEM